MVGQLRVLRATTPEGLRAKARAIMALDSAAIYCDCRNDAAQIWQSIVEDMAGPDWPRVGEGAQMMNETIPFSATVADAVRLSGIGRTELYRLLGEGSIKAKKSGRRTLILMDSVRDYVQRLPDLKHPQ